MVINSLIGFHLGRILKAVHWLQGPRNTDKIKAKTSNRTESVGEDQTVSIASVAAFESDEILVKVSSKSRAT